MPSSSPTTTILPPSPSVSADSKEKHVKFSDQAATATVTATAPHVSETKDTTETEERWSQDAQIFEYGSAANPDMKPIPVVVHPAELHESGATRVIPFDVSDALEIEHDYACTSPNLLASFLRINVGDGIATEASNATSQAFYVIRGSGHTTVVTQSQSDGNITNADNDTPGDETISWTTGDLFVVPVTPSEMLHVCTSVESHGGAALYWIHDEPLMNYLGATPNVRKFEPTLYKKDRLLEKVEEIRHETGECHTKNRLGVLLGNAKCAQTKTLTHVLWSLLNSIPGHSVQRPHRHNSVALDLCVSAAVPEAGSSSGAVYTLMGKEIDSDGFIVDPIRCDWIPGSAFMTPPGWWHSHHNESDDVAWVLPVQDAGLYTHQRTLDIRFVDDELLLHKAGRIRGSSFAITNKAYTQMVNIGPRVPSPVSGEGGLTKNKNRGMKRIFSAESLLTSKRHKCTQVGAETVG